MIQPMMNHEKISKRRLALVGGLFALSLFPFKGGMGDMAWQLFFMIAAILFTCGCIMWKPSYPLFARGGHMLHMQNRIVPHVFLMAAYTAFLVMAVGFGWHCFGFIPGYGDSVGQYVQGKFIAAGELYGTTPPLRRFFPAPMMVDDGKWYAQYQPLHVMLLGLGHFLDAPWLVNPVEGALTLVAIYFLTRRIFDEATARIAVLLTLGCSFMIFMSAEFMNHATALLFTTLMALCYVEMLEALPFNRKAAYSWALGAGLSVGAVFLTRPLTAIGVGLPFAIHAVILLRRDWRHYLTPFLIMGMAGFTCLLFDLWYNQQTTGAYFIFPTGKYHGGSNTSAMGIKGSVSAIYALTKMQNEWMRLSRQLFEWVVPSTFFVVLFCLLPIRNIYARLLLGMVASHTIVNLANQYPSGAFGPRYMYEVTSALIILSAAGIMRIPFLLETLRMPLPDRATLHGIIALPIVLLFIISFAFAWPQTTWRFTHNFFNNHPERYYSLLEKAEKPALIFVGRGKNTDEKYKSVSFTNPPSDDAPVIFAIDRGDELDRYLVARYPGRHNYVEYDNALLPLDSAAKP